MPILKKSVNKSILTSCLMVGTLMTSVLSWSIFGQVSTTVENPCNLLSQNDMVLAHMYVSYPDAKSLKTHMQAMLHVYNPKLKAYDSDLKEYGEIPSYINYIDTDALKRNEEDLSKSLILFPEESLPVEVIATVENFDKNIPAGTTKLKKEICTAKIIVDKKAPLFNAFPYLKPS